MMNTTVSREHTTLFLKRERQNIEKLRADMGSEVVAKMNRPLVRDLLYERKEEELADLFTMKPESVKHHIMVSGASVRNAFTGATRPAAPRERRQRVTLMRRTGTKKIEAIESDLKAHGAAVLNRLWLTHSVVARATTNQVEVAAARGDVGSVIAVKRSFVACLDVSRPLIGANQVASNLGFTGNGVTVAIIDTGVDTTHPALAGVVTSQQDFTGMGIGDGVGHGTHCAGIVASQNENFRGIAPGVTIQDFRMMDNVGASDPTWAIAAVQAAVTAGVNIASNSWGWSHMGGWECPEGHCDLCNAADAAVTAGVVFVVAAGNEGEDGCGGSSADTQLRCPGNARLAITVAASDDADHIAAFSSNGPTPDGRAKPDITAPGVDIASCMPRHKPWPRSGPGGRFCQFLRHQHGLPPHNRRSGPDARQELLV